LKLIDPTKLVLKTRIRYHFIIIIKKKASNFSCLLWCLSDRFDEIGGILIVLPPTGISGSYCTEI
jgi:hypothetical protein